MSQPPASNSKPPLDVKQMIYLYQVLENQQAGLIEQITILNSQIQGFDTSLSSLEGFKNSENDHEIIIGLGYNAFTYAKVIDPNRILVSVGKDILIEKTLEESIADIKVLTEKTRGIRERLGTTLQEVNAKIDEIRPIIENVSKQR
ncbi:MAG: prefoldin subunit alpha [Promethearchaeota archaeon]